MIPLAERIDRIARVPVLLVACDFDGTLSPIVRDPAAARAHPEALEALRVLSRLPRTHVVVISGRSVRDLRALASFPEDVQLVGSHGAELDAELEPSLPVELVELKDEIRRRLLELAAPDPGFLIEEKPGGLAFHYRNADERAACRAIAEIERELEPREDVFARRGRKVIELNVVEASKGEALDALSNRTGADATFYIGDDLTDEQAFARLRDCDVGVKVGPGDTCAPYRVADTREAAGLVVRLSELRAAWADG